MMKLELFAAGNWSSQSLLAHPTFPPQFGRLIEFKPAARHRSPPRQCCGMAKGYKDAAVLANDIRVPPRSKMKTASTVVADARSARALTTSGRLADRPVCGQETKNPGPCQDRG